MNRPSADRLIRLVYGRTIAEVAAASGLSVSKILRHEKGLRPLHPGEFAAYEAAIRGGGTVEGAVAKAVIDSLEECRRAERAERQS